MASVGEQVGSIITHVHAHMEERLSEMGVRMVHAPRPEIDDTLNYQPFSRTTRFTRRFDLPPEHRMEGIKQEVTAFLSTAILDKLSQCAENNIVRNPHIEYAYGTDDRCFAIEFTGQFGEVIEKV